jgi:hypothetical protein
MPLAGALVCALVTGCTAVGPGQDDSPARKEESTAANPTSKSQPPAQASGPPEMSVQQFAGEVQRLSHAGKSAAFADLARNFEGRLTRGVRAHNLTDYVTQIRGAGLPPEARAVALRSLIEGRKSLGQPALEDHLQALTDILGDQDLAPELKSVVLRKIGAHPALADHGLFRPFLRSGDQHLRASAFRGLSSFIIAARRRQDAPLNRRILAELTADPAPRVDVELVRALALTGLDESRRFVLERAKGQPELLATFLFHDPTGGHRETVSEALDLVTAGPADQDLVNALHQNLEDPSPLVAGFLAGDGADTLRGLKLLRLFPARVPQHAATIRQRLTSPDRELRRAALALVPHLDDPKAVIDELTAGLGETAKFEFHSELTAAIAR